MNRNSVEKAEAAGWGARRAEDKEELAVSDVAALEETNSLVNLHAQYTRYLEDKYRSKIDKKTDEYYAFLRREHEKEVAEKKHLTKDAELEAWVKVLNLKDQYQLDLYRGYKLKVKKKTRHFIKFQTSRLERLDKQLNPDRDPGDDF